MVSVAGTLTGVAISAGIAAVARRVRALSVEGAVAAVAVGAAALAAGWKWGALLVAFFVASSALSAVGRARKDTLTAGVVAKGGERDAVQVLANGGVFALAAMGFVAWGSLAWNAIAAGAIATATADTWATEIGGLSTRPPRSILTLKEVAPGTSGGVTLLGVLAMVIGAGFIQLGALAVGWAPAIATGALAGGVAGSLADSLLGALVQHRRWCEHCETATERIVHTCGNASVASGGMSWMNNDAVNAIATAIGGGIAWAVAARA